MVKQFKLKLCFFFQHHIFFKNNLNENAAWSFVMRKPILLLQTCQPCKILNLEILAKNLENLEIQ